MITGVVLAAGEGRRIGTPKALLRAGRGAETFVERALGTLRKAGVSSIVVVVSSAILEEVRRLVSGATVCVNRMPERGQLSSLHVAIDALAAEKPDALIVLPVDIPLVTPATVSKLVDVWRRTRMPVIRPTRGASHGHPVIFDARLFHDLRAADLAVGAKSIVHKYATAEGDVPIDDDGAFSDIDTPAQYRRAFGLGEGDALDFD